MVENELVWPAWVWPSWLKVAAVVRTKQGGIWGCEKVPTRDPFIHTGWANTGNTMNLHPDSAKFACIDDYPAGTWEESLRVNPNLKVQDVPSDAAQAIREANITLHCDGCRVIAIADSEAEAMECYRALVEFRESKGQDDAE